jgi:hypothetical protein
MFRTALEFDAITQERICERKLLLRFKTYFGSTLKDGALWL